MEASDQPNGPSRDEKLIPPQHYLSPRYDTKSRFASYWYQIHEVMAVGADTVLEIGTGNGFVAAYLRRHGQKVVSVDVNTDLLPTVVASVEALPFADRSFEAVVACEVLEHLPWHALRGCLGEIRRVCARTAILSVPDHRRVWQGSITLPFYGAVCWQVTGPPPAGLVPDPAHCWEMGCARVRRGDLVQLFEDAGLALQRDWRPFEKPDHHFFVLAAREH